jgi:outer membrane protein assembly factor BamB
VKNAGVCALIAAALLAGCGPTARHRDATSAAVVADPGLPVLSIFWKREVADTRRETAPQEFASPVVYTSASLSDDRVYVGSRTGWFYALSAKTSEVIWKRRLGSISSRPLLDRGFLYVGTDDGYLICMDLTGRELWRYETRGPILQTPVLADDAILVANEADQVYSLDRQTGKFRWQYKGETPEEFTLRGHSGVTVHEDLAYVGLSNGSLVALRTATGSVAWLATLGGGQERFVDVDATPVLVGDAVVAASAAGGLYSLDQKTGRVRWRLDVKGVGGIVADEKGIYFVAANFGVYGLDLDGNILWRVGTRGGGEPSQPLVHGDYLFFTLAQAGLYVADKRTGTILQYFDPGYGVSSQPTLSRQRLYVLSNGAVLYAMSVHDFDA